MSTTMEGENRITLMGAAEDGGECLFARELPHVSNVLRWQNMS